MAQSTDVLRSLADDAVRTGLREFARAVVERLLAPRLEGAKERCAELSAAVEQVVRGVDPDRFGRHIADGATWAGMTHVHGMSSPIDTEESTVALDMTPIQRRFRASDRPNEIIGERTSPRERRPPCPVPRPSPFVGDPGSGKTTTPQRLTLTMFDSDLRQSRPLSPPSQSSWVCREINWAGPDLPSQIAQRLGADLGRLSVLLDSRSGEHLILVAELMDQLKCLLVVDGIDEIGPEFRSDVVEAIARLHRQLRVSRIVCSSRSGDAPHLEGFSTAAGTSSP